MEATETAALFRTVQVGPYMLPNRIVMSAPTRTSAGADNVPVTLNAAYYGARASAGLMVSEASQVSLQGVGCPGTPGIYSARQVVAWRRITEVVHDRGGHIFLQLWHAGRISHPLLQPGGNLPVAPSAIAPSGTVPTQIGLRPFVTPRALETWEIPEIVDQFQRAALNAWTAGFDGVEIHAGFGYLIDQFLRDGTNRRSDHYGSSLVNRARLALEVTRAVAEVWGAERVGIKLTPSSTVNDMHDSHPEAIFGHLVEQVDRLGLAYLHLVRQSDADERNGGKPVPLAYFRPLFHGPIIASGDLDQVGAEGLIDDGIADLGAFGRLFQANPDLPECFRSHAPLNHPGPITLFAGNDYADNLALDLL